jgi:hypothetical protein
MASDTAMVANDTVRAVLQRYGDKLDAVTCEEEPPRKVRSCQSANGGKAIRLHLRYDSKLLFSPARGGVKTKILDAYVLSMEEDNR